AVVSEPIVAPRYTPCAQLKLCSTSGTVVARRPPKMIAEIGTPSASSALSERIGLLRIGAVKREFGCAAGGFEAGVHGSPRQSVSSAGGSPSLPSHHTSPSFVMATLVKMVSRAIDAIAFGLVLVFVP